MAEVYALSDHHLFHENIIRFTKDDGSLVRPFSSLEEMHETIIERHNSLVRPTDHFYFGGDITFRLGGAFNNVMSRLNGHKRAIVGNHDDRFLKNFEFTKHFDKILLWRGFKEHNFTLSHMPLKEGHFRDGKYNAHGHTHWNMVEGPYINICCEPRNYFPVNIEEIAAEARNIK